MCLFLGIAQSSIRLISPYFTEDHFSGGRPEEAFAALRSVCNDPKAPAPARATAATSIFRAAGLFDKTDAAADDKPLSELTAEELNRIVRRHQRAPTTSSAPRAERGAPDEDEVDAFE
ncbi:MAG: hypothetical protein WDN46_25000 [Methylocella sp.]